MKALLLKVLSKEKGDLNKLINMLCNEYGSENVKVKTTVSERWLSCNVDVILDKK